MSEFTAKVSRAGQIVIPKILRDIEGIAVGDYVVMQFKEVKKA